MNAPSGYGDVRTWGLGEKGTDWMRTIGPRFDHYSVSFWAY